MAKRRRTIPASSQQLKGRKISSQPARAVERYVYPVDGGYDLNLSTNKLSTC